MLSLIQNAIVKGGKDRRLRVEGKNNVGVRPPCPFSLTTQTGALFASIFHIPTRASVVATALQQMELIP